MVTNKSVDPDRMTCDEMAANLTDFLEGDLAPDMEAVALEHLATCDDCTRVLNTTRAVTQIARDHGRVELSPVEHRHLLAAVLESLDDVSRA